MCILEWVAVFLYIGYLILCYRDSFQKPSVHSCLHYTLHICICFNLGGSPGSDTDDGTGMYSPCFCFARFDMCACFTEKINCI